MLFDVLVAGYLRQNAVRSFTAALAIAIGVATITALAAVRATTAYSVETALIAFDNPVNVQVAGGIGGFPDSAYSVVGRRPDVIMARPIVEGEVNARFGSSGAFTALSLVGVDMLQRLPGGIEPRDELPGPYAARGGAPQPETLFDRQTVVISRTLARTFRLHEGSQFTASAGGRAFNMRVAAIGSDSELFDSNVIFSDFTSAQLVLGKRDMLDRLDLIVDPMQAKGIAASLRSALGSRLTVSATADPFAELRAILDKLNLCLTIISVLALAVASMFVYNGIAFSVSQRRHEIGILRTLGAPREGIFGAFLLEGALIGIAGSLEGCALSVFFILSLSGWLSRSAGLAADAPAQPVAFDLWGIFIALIAGVGCATLSAIVPAVEAAMTQPGIVLRPRATVQIKRTALITGILITVALGAALIAAAVTTHWSALAWVGLFLMTLVAFAVIPVMIKTVARSIARMPYGGSAGARLASMTVTSAPGRTAAAVIALSTTIAMIMVALTVINSLKSTTIGSSDSVNRSDLLIRPSGSYTGGECSVHGDVTLPNGVVARVKAVPGVDAVDAITCTTASVAGHRAFISGRDIAVASTRGDLQSIGRDVESSHQSDAAGWALVSTAFAQRNDLRLHDSTAIKTPRGTLAIRIEGVVPNSSMNDADVVIDQSLFSQYFQPPHVAAVEVFAHPGVDLESLRASILSVTAQTRPMIAKSGELRRRMSMLLGAVFEICYAIAILAMIVGTMGVIVTLAGIIIERRVDIATLRYLGLSRKSVQFMILIEASVFTVVALCLGIAIGVAIAVLIIFASHFESPAIDLRWDPPYLAMFAAATLCAAIILLGGMIPARLASRVRTDVALAAE